MALSTKNYKQLDFLQPKTIDNVERQENNDFMLTYQLQNFNPDRLTKYVPPAFDASTVEHIDLSAQTVQKVDILQKQNGFTAEDLKNIDNYTDKATIKYDATPSGNGVAGEKTEVKDGKYFIYNEDSHLDTMKEGTTITSFDNWGNKKVTADFSPSGGVDLSGVKAEIDKPTAPLTGPTRRETGNSLGANNQLNAFM